MEIWKDIKGYEGLYQVSETGKIKRLNSFAKTKRGTLELQLKEKIMKQSKSKKKYMMVRLTKNNIRKSFYVARIVAENFIENKYCKMEVNHISGDKSDNSVGNLEWVTRVENMEHAVKTRLTASGERVATAKLKKEEVLAAREMYSRGDISTANIAKIYGVDNSTIWRVVARKSWINI